jgi:hypothetical protein
MLHRMGRNVQRKSNSVAKHRAATQKTAKRTSFRPGSMLQRRRRR